MAHQIVFQTIDTKEQASKVQFESKIMYNVDGKEVYPEEETDWIYQDFSGFAPKKFIEDPAKRDWVKIQLDPQQKACIELKKQLEKNDKGFEENKKQIFGKFEKIYSFLPSVKQPKGSDEDVFSDDENDEDKEKPEITETKPKYESAKFKLKMDWFYYYNDKRLDKFNTSAIKKAVSELMKNTKTANLDKDKKKAAISALPITLTFKDDEGKKETVNVLMKDLEQRKEIDTKVFHRKPEKLELGAKKPHECTEEELIQIYGDPMEPKDVRTPDDLDQYYGHRSYIRLLYRPRELWASKDKMAGAEKRTCGIRYIIYQIDIIQIPYESTFSSTQKSAYSKYAFGNKKNMLINQSVDNTFTSADKTSDENANNGKLSDVQKETKVESDSENEGPQSEAEDSGSESAESAESAESETESEEEVQVKPAKKSGAKNTKTVVETPAKATKTNKRTK